MYGAKATSTLFNTVTRQGALAKQLIAPKSTAFLSQLPTRHVSGKISYTTSTRSTQLNQKSVQKQQQQDSKVEEKAQETIPAPQPNGAWLNGKTILDASQIDVCILSAAKAENPTKVISTFIHKKKSAEGEPVKLSAQTYEAVIDAFGKLQDNHWPLDHMMDAYNKLIDSGVKPSSHINAMIIKLLCARNIEVFKTVSVLRRRIARTGEEVEDLVRLEAEGNLEKALDIFKKSVMDKNTDSFDLELYNDMLTSLSRGGTVENSIYILNHLENNCRYKPNENTFAALMSVFGTAGDITSVRECFMEYISMRNKIPSHDPSYIYNTLVAALVNAGDINGALNIVQNTMVRDNVTVSINPYNKIFRKLCREDNLELVLPLLEKLESDPSLPKPNAGTYAAVMSIHIRRNDIESADKIYEKFIKHDISKEYGHFADYFYVCIKNQKPDIALKIITDMNNGGLKLDNSMCEKIITYHLDAGKPEEVIRTFRTIIEGMSQSSYITKKVPLVNFAMNISTKLEDFSNTLFIFEMLKRYSIGPDSYFSEMLLTRFNKVRSDPVQWEKVSQRMEQVSFSVLFDATFRRHSAPEEFCQTALNLFDDMTALKIESPPSLYIRVLMRMKKYLTCTEYENLWIEKYAPYLPNSVVNQKVSDDMSVLETVNCVTADADFLTGKALKLVLEGRYEDSIHVLKHEIINHGNIPTADAIRDIIQECTKLGKLDVITEVYRTVLPPIQRLEGHNKTRALTIIYNAMLISYARLDSLDAAKVFYNNIIAIKSFPNGDAYATLLNNSPQENVEDCKEAEFIYNEVKKNKVQPTVYFYNVMMSKYAKAQRLEKVFELLNDMKESGLVPNPVTYSTIISAALRCGNEDLAIEYFKEMKSAKRYKPRAGPFASFILFYAQKADKEKTLHYYNMAKENNLKLPDHTLKMIEELME